MASRMEACGVANGRDKSSPPTNSRTEATKRYVHLKGFLTNEEQQELVRSTFECHRSNSAHSDGHDKCDEWKSLGTDTVSTSLNLGLAYTGAPMNNEMNPALTFSRRSFEDASKHYLDAGKCDLSVATSRLASPDECDITGIALLYGPNGKMLAHYDAPTQKGRRDEWLVGFSVGADTMFRCNDEVVLLKSGDALVMDSMAVLHGVEGICGQVSSVDVEQLYGLPFQGSRLGVLLWQSAEPSKNRMDVSKAEAEGVDVFDSTCGGVLKSLFVTGSDSEESDDGEEVG